MAIRAHPGKENNATSEKLAFVEPDNPLLLAGIVRTLLMILMLTGIYGCVDVVTDIEFPDTEPKMVVHSFISPSDTAVQVMLSWSNPLHRTLTPGSTSSQESIRYIENATVRISEKGQSGTPVPFYPKKNVYSLPTSTFPIYAGKHYTLIVEVDGYETVTGSCHIPLINNTLQLDKLDIEDMEWSELIHLEYSFTDIPGQNENFYTQSAYIDEWMHIYEEDTLIAEKRKFDIISGEIHVSNKGREGRRFFQRAQAYTYRYDLSGESSNDILQNDSIHLLLLSTDEHYYHYHRTLDTYVPDNPFAEPVMVYSNIEGGLGVFAGFNRFEIGIALPDQ